MNKATINGIECMVVECERFKKDMAPSGFPYMYQGRHHSNDWSHPISIERFVGVNFWGTIFSPVPLLEEEFDYINIKSIEYEDISMDSMQEVCPECAGCLAYGKIMVTGSILYASVECGCGYKGREEYSMTSYTTSVADSNYEGTEPNGSVVCPSCHSEVVLPTDIEVDGACLDFSVDCSFCGASIEASISCIFEGNIALPMPA